MRQIFGGFCKNWFLIDPLHYLSSRSAFGFEFAEIFIIEADSPTQRVGESAFECLTENSASRRVVDIPPRQVGSHHGESWSRYSNFQTLNN
jgi:hypothetical protein